MVGGALPCGSVYGPDSDAGPVNIGVWWGTVFVPAADKGAIGCGAVSGPALGEGPPGYGAVEAVGAAFVGACGAVVALEFSYIMTLSKPLRSRLTKLDLFNLMLYSLNILDYSLTSGHCLQQQEVVNRWLRDVRLAATASKLLTTQKPEVAITWFLYEGFRD